VHLIVKVYTEASTTVPITYPTTTTAEKLPEEVKKSFLSLNYKITVNYKIRNFFK